MNIFIFVDIVESGNNFPDTLLVVVVGVFDIDESGTNFSPTLLVAVGVFDIDESGTNFPDTLLVVVAGVFDIDECSEDDIPETSAIVGIDECSVDFPAIWVDIGVSEIDEIGNDVSITLLVVAGVFDIIDEAVTDCSVIVTFIVGDIDESVENFPTCCFGDVVNGNFFTGFFLRDFFRKQQTNNTYKHVDFLVSCIQSHTNTSLFILKSKWEFNCSIFHQLKDYIIQYVVHFSHSCFWNNFSSS